MCRTLLLSDPCAGAMPVSATRQRNPARLITAGALAATGLVLLFAAVTMHGRSMPRDFGITSAPPMLAATTVGPPLARPIATPRGRPSRQSSATLRQPAAPSEVTISKLGVQAVVQPVLNSNGQLDVPTDPARLGWWTGSALIGATSGTVVLDGHVDSAGTGPGALFRLTSLQATDRITITTAAGQRQDYQVIGRRVYVKAKGLPPDLFTPTGPPRLTLITCGGPFDPTTLSYLDNIVIFAIPTPDQQSVRAR
jgi:Sortase domain